MRENMEQCWRHIMRLVLGYLAVLWGQDNLAGSINEVSRFIYFNMSTLSHPPMSYWRVYGNRIAKTLMQADTSSVRYFVATKHPPVSAFPSQANVGTLWREF